jgi:hypothetical protein
MHRRTRNRTDRGIVSRGGRVTADRPPGSTDCEVSGTLRAARERVESLADVDGPYYIACRRSGVRPEPVTDARFERLADAERALDAARRYRDALASLDPSCTRYDLDVYESNGPDVSVTRVRETGGGRRENGLPASRQSVLLAGTRADEWLRMENGPVVHVVARGSLLDDEDVARQLDVKL